MLSRLKFKLTDLANEMLDQLPKSVFESTTTTFCDPAIGGGQMIAAVESRLRAYGHSDENIASRVFGFEENPMRLRFARHKYNLVAQLNIYKLDESEINMKFDVTLTNPPFTKTTNGSNQAIYQRFYNLATEITDGHVGVICPKNLLAKMHTGKVDSVPVRVYQPTLISFDNVEKHFPKVGSTFCYFIVNTIEQPTSARVLLPNQEVDADVTSESFEYIETPEALAFIQKYNDGETYTVTEATAGKYVIDDPDGQYIDFNTNATCFVDPSKRFKGVSPIGISKFVTAKKMTSGKPDELIPDVDGKYVWKDNMHYSIIIDDGADLNTVKANTVSLMEEFKIAFSNVNLKGFVWNTFFKIVAKHHLNG